MGLSLTLRQKLDLRLEMRQELRLKLLQKIPEEFQTFISVDSDEDMDLLFDSLPFLVLHELAHPLQREGRLIVPKYEYNVPAGISAYEFDHNANEVGIDRGAVLAGVHAGLYQKDEMHDSQAYLVERVFRDITEKEVYEMSDTIYSRLYAGLKENKLNTLSPSVQRHLDDVCEKIDNSIEPDQRKRFDSMVNHYRRIYLETALANVR